MSKLTDEQLLIELKTRFIDNKRSVKELKELTDQLKIVNHKLKDSEALKTNFLSNIRNEIVNPFASIIGLARSILSMKVPNYERINIMASLIQTEAFALDFQLQNIFAAAEIEAGENQLEIYKVDINQLVQSVIDTFQHEADKKRISIERSSTLPKNEDGISYFNTDSEKLKLIIANLLSNAIKFSFFEGKIEIKIWLNENILNVSVRDYGSGVTKENKKIIFDRFTRIDSGINTLNRGHGLGLSINKALLDVLDGKIELKTEKDKGSVFTIILPESVTPEGTEGLSLDASEFLFGDEGGEMF